MNATVAEIAELVGGTVVGDGSVRITGLNGIRQAGPGELSFISSQRYVSCLGTTRAGALLVTPDIGEAAVPLIQVANPYAALLMTLQRFMPLEPAHPARGVHPAAVLGENVRLGDNVAVDALVRIADNATLGNNVVVYAGSYIGAGAAIGDDTVIYPRVSVLEGVRVGARCVLHSGVVLGGDGFGFIPGAEGAIKIPQVGIVVLQDDVEVGANSCIDRATFGETVIGKGTKIDNLVQIGHNVETGLHCIICGNAGISGSARLGNQVTIAAGAGVAGHIEVGDRATVAGLSGVTKSVEAGKVVSGFPAVDHERDKRVVAAQRALPEALRKLRALQRRVEELEGRLNGTPENDS